MRELDREVLANLHAAGGGDGRPLLLSLRGLRKHYGPTRAVDGVDLEVGPSEILGLMGGNGAGKSTLVRIVGGLVAPDGGEIDLLGRRLDASHSALAARELGLRFVHQELSLCPSLRIFENFVIELPDRLGGLRWKRRALALAAEALEAVFPGHGLDPRAKVGALSLSQRQMVEIARALAHPATRLAILDEPTSSLGSREAEQFRAFLKRRRTEGLSFVFISHRLHETLDLADRIAVMRNGRLAWAGAAGEIDHERLVGLLGGGVAAGPAPAGDAAVPAGPRLAEITLHGGGAPRTIRVARGEVVGLGGLEGSGQREVLRAAFSGAEGTATARVAGRFAYVSGDRATEGVFPLWSIDDNVTASSLRRHRRGGLLDRARLGALARLWFDRLAIKAPGGAVPITTLSGGNQQKALIARALASGADLVLLDDPTRGVDLGTKAQAYGLIRDFAAGGGAALWYSTEDAELFECDRAVILRDRAVVAEFPRSALTPERLVAASFRNPAEAEAATLGQRLAQAAQRREQWASAMIPLVTLATVLLWSVVLNPRIASPFGVTLIFSAAFVLAFAATSQLFVIAAADIDLGLGAFIGLVNAVAATWLVTDPWLAGLCVLGLLAAYPAMALFIEARRVPAIIVTLGLSFVWLGFAALRLPRAGGSAPDWLVGLTRFEPPLVPLPLLLCVLPAAVAYGVLLLWRYGAVLRGYGASPRAVEAAGWSGLKAKATLYGLAGLFAVLAGLLVTASTRGGDPTGSASLTLLSVAAVILGGAAFSGGVVAPFGALFGTLTLVFVGTLLSLLGVNAVFLPMVQGLLLLGAVGLRTLIVRRGAVP